MWWIEWMLFFIKCVTNVLRSSMKQYFVCVCVYEWMNSKFIYNIWFMIIGDDGNDDDEWMNNLSISRPLKDMCKYICKRDEKLCVKGYQKRKKREMI